MDLVEVDVLGAEPGEGCVDLFEDRLARQALPAGAVVHLPPHLGRQDDVLAASVAGDSAADHLLGCATLVHVRCIPEGHPHLDGLPEEGLCIGIVECPWVCVRGHRWCRAQSAGDGHEAHRTKLASRILSQLASLLAVSTERL